MKEPNLVKKPPLTNRAMANQKKILIVAVVCVVALLISTSYAVLTSFDQTDDAVITFTTGNLEMSISREQSEITLTTLSNKLPEGDDTGLLNATPIPLTFENTGTITIGKYSVSLIAETDTENVSDLNQSFIRYAVSEDGTTYGEATSLNTNNNIIFTGTNLAVDATKTIYLKIWISDTAGNDALNKSFYGSIQVDLEQEQK